MKLPQKAVLKPSRYCSDTEPCFRSPFVKLEANTSGVFCCDWSDVYKVVVCCGADKKINLFNPFSGRRQAIIQGHTSPVTHVAVNDADNQIISLGSVCHCNHCC